MSEKSECTSTVESDSTATLFRLMQTALCGHILGTVHEKSS